MPFTHLLPTLLLLCNLSHALTTVALPSAKLSKQGSLPLLPYADIEICETADQSTSCAPLSIKDGCWIDLGYDARIVRVTFETINESSRPVSAVLHLKNPTLDRITLFKEHNGTLYPIGQGGILSSLHPFKDAILEPHFTLHQPPRSQQRYILEAESNSSALRLSPRISTSEVFFQEAVARQMFLSLFFGAMGALILYNLFIFLFTRQKAYLYYTLYHLFAVINYLSYTSMVNYLLPQRFWKADAYLAVFYQSAGIFFMLLFARSFLRTKRHPKIEKVFRALLATTALLALWGVFHPVSFPILLSMLLAAVSILWVFSLAWYMAFRKEHNGIVLAASWTFATLGHLSLALYDSGMPSPLHRFPNLYEWCMLIEATLFSIALSRRLNLTQKLAVALERNRLLLRELNHRVKNNMQFISSLYRMKLYGVGDPETMRKIDEAEGAVWAMQTVHEMLYGVSSESTIDLGEYISTLTKRLGESFGGDVRFKLDIRARSDAEEAIRIGTLLNELITNTFKHAFPSSGKRATIEIALFERDGEKRLLFRDNGIGCPDRHKGFGLTLVTSIVEKELRGTITKERGEGCGYLIAWSTQTPRKNVLDSIVER